MCVDLIRVSGCVLALMVCGHAIAGQSLADLDQALESPDETVRTEAMRRFELDGPEYFGVSSLPLIKKGLKDPNEDVQKHAVYALQRYAAAGVSSIRDSEISQRLIAILADHSEGRVAAEAANAHAFIYGVTDDLGEAAVRRVDVSKDPAIVSMLLGVLEEQGIKRGADEETVLRILQGPPSDAALAAVRVAEESNIDSALLIGEVMRLAQSEELFAHPRLLKVLTRHPGEATKYLPDLYQMQERLTEELQKGLFERTVQIDNDAFWLDSLKSALNSLETVERSATTKD